MFIFFHNRFHMTKYINWLQEQKFRFWNQRCYYSKLCNMEGRDEVWKLNLLGLLWNLAEGWDVWEGGGQHVGDRLYAEAAGCWSERTHSVYRYSTWISHTHCIALSLLCLSQINKRSLSSHEYMWSLWKRLPVTTRHKIDSTLFLSFESQCVGKNVMLLGKSWQFWLVWLCVAGTKHSSLFDSLHREVLKNSFI